MWKITIVKDLSHVSPKDIVKTQCEYLKEQTEGRVIAEISNYDGQIASYSRMNYPEPIASVIEHFPHSKNVDIQDNLGDIGNSPIDRYTFEFYLMSKSVIDYKYRIMFMRYSEGYYPVDIVLDEDIALEIGTDLNIICSNEMKFKDLLRNILNSFKINRVVNSLYVISLRENSNENTT